MAARGNGASDENLLYYGMQLLSIEGLLDATERLAYSSTQGNVALRRAPRARVEQPALPSIA
jgi:hypothetical protein